MSIVHNQFPVITWRDGEKHLWNSIQKKALKNRPEERVRLRVMEYLLQTGRSKHRISTEEGITLGKRRRLRTDLICYSDKFEPLLLVECKASQINISGQTAEQIACYNEKVKAPFLLMTNGKKDLWYSFQDKQPALQNDVPKIFRANHTPATQPFEFWTERGFAGKKAGPELRKWLTKTLNEAIYGSKPPVQYLSFKKTFSDFDLSHYYQIVGFAESQLALAFIATAFGGSRLAVIQNENGKNSGLLEINLDLLFDGEMPNASFYGDEGAKNIDIRTILSWDSDLFSLEWLGKKIHSWLSQ